MCVRLFNLKNGGSLDPNICSRDVFWKPNTVNDLTPYVKSGYWGIFNFETHDTKQKKI